MKRKEITNIMSANRFSWKWAIRGNCLFGEMAFGVLAFGKPTFDGTKHIFLKKVMNTNATVNY